MGGECSFNFEDTIKINLKHIAVRIRMSGAVLPLSLVPSRLAQGNFSFTNTE